MPRESTLGGRDDRTINLDQHLSKIFGAVHRETVDMLFTATRAIREKCRSGKAFRPIVRCTENFALWTAKRVAKEAVTAHSSYTALVNQNAARLGRAYLQNRVAQFAG
jgi:hypothetical protein